MAKRKLKKKAKKTILITLIVFISPVLMFMGKYYYTYLEDIKPKEEENKKYYTISDFGFIIPISNKDYNNNGIDDSTEIFMGAKEYASFNPYYKSEYYSNGYPPVKKEGVCTDLIWYSIDKAGYNLKKMIDQDIINTEKKHIYNIDAPDQNIDFRRVSNQEMFFIRYAESLDTDYSIIGNYMPGDILSFDYSSHIAMVSDKINKEGVPYLIQNRDETQKEKEEDRLEETDMKVTGHYRFTYSDDLQELINQIKA